jgi:glycosyltransferase involved in cell wall biosynthesis
MISRQPPILSILIATRNRADILASCLDAAVISLNKAGLDNAEFIVVNNGSTDNTQQVLDAWTAQSSYPVRALYEAEAGLSCARNRALHAALGEYVLFTDDDCHLTPEYVSDFLAYINSDTEATMRSGSVILGDDRDLPLTIKLYTENREWKRPMSISEEGRLLGDALIGCNFTAPRQICLQIGDFDTLLGAGKPCKASEDTDYFYRAYLNGNRLQVVPNMVVRHFHGRRTAEERDRLLANYAIGNGALIIKYLFIYPRFSKHYLWLFKSLWQLMYQLPASKKRLAEKADYIRQVTFGMGIYAYYYSMLKLRSLR